MALTFRCADSCVQLLATVRTGSGLALVDAYLLAGELAAAGWDPAAAFAGYETRTRPFVEANQEIDRMHAHSRDVPGPDAEPSPELDMESLMELVVRAIKGGVVSLGTRPDNCALVGDQLQIDVQAG